MPKSYHDVVKEFKFFKKNNPDDPTELVDFAKQVDQLKGTPGERSSAYTTGVFKSVSSGIDTAFETTQLPQIAGAIGRAAGTGFDKLAGTNVASVIEHIGRDTPRMIAEGFATIPAVASGVGAPAAGAVWLNRLRQIAGYGSAFARGTADTDSLAGGAISAASLGAANKLLLPAKYGGKDVGGKAEHAVTKWLGRETPEIVASEGANMLAKVPQLTTSSAAQKFLPPAARLATDVAAVTGVNELTRQGMLSVGPNAVGLTDEARNPFTAENIAGNVAGAVGFAPQAVLGFMGRPKLVPKQVEQLKKWLDTRHDAEQAYRGYDWEGPITPQAYHDTFGTTKDMPGFRGQDLIPVEDYWTPENLGLGDRKVASDAAANVKFVTVLKTQVDALKQQKAEGQEQLANMTKESIYNLLSKGGEAFAITPEQVVQVMKELDTTARQLPPEDVKGFAKFVSDLNGVIDEINENTANFTDEQKTDKTKGQTWHPDARSTLVTERLQAKGLIPKITPEWLKTELDAEYNQSGDPQFSYHVVLQKAANKVINLIPDALAKEKSMPSKVETEFSPNVQGAFKQNERFVDALTNLPDEVRDELIARTGEIFSKKPYISRVGNTAGRLVDQVGSWRKAIIQAVESYNPETMEVLVRSGSKVIDGKRTPVYKWENIRYLTARDEHGNFLWDPSTSAVTIGEGGKSTKSVGKKTIPEVNIEDLPQSENLVPDEAYDEAVFRQELEAPQPGIALKEGELPAKLGVKAGEEKLPEGALGTTTPEFMTEQNLSRVTALKAKLPVFQKNMDALTDEQLYNAVKDQFQGRSSVGLPTADPLRIYRKGGGLRTALKAAYEYLSTKQIGPAGQAFLDAEVARGNTPQGTTPADKVRRTLRDFFKHKVPVDGGTTKVEAWLARVGAIVDKVSDPKLVDTVKKGAPGGKALISDDIDPAVAGVIPQDEDPTKAQIFYHGTKHAKALRGKPVDPSNHYNFMSLSKIPDVASNFGPEATYQVLVRKGKIFDYHSPEHIAQLVADLEGYMKAGKMDHKKLKPDQFKTGFWQYIEHFAPQMKDLGYDGFYTHEMGAKNIHVFDPHKSLVYIPDAQKLKKGQETVDPATLEPLPYDVRRTVGAKIEEVLGGYGYSGSIRDLYTEMATATVLGSETGGKVPIDFYTLVSQDYGRAAVNKMVLGHPGAAGRIGVNLAFDPTKTNELKWMNRILGTLAHELTHIDQWVLSGQIDAPDAFSEQRRRHLQNIDSLSKVLSSDERQAILETLRDGMLPKEVQLDIRDPKTGRVYGADDPSEFHPTIMQLVVGSLLNSKPGTLKNALEVLDFSPTEVRELSQGTYRSIHDTMNAMKSTIANPHVRATYGKSLPNVNLFTTSEAFHAVVNAAREGSMLRHGDKMLAEAREYIAALDVGAAAGGAPLTPSSAMWTFNSKPIAENFQNKVDFSFNAKAMPSETALAAIEEAGQVSGMTARAYDKSMKPSIWSRWFTPFAQLMFGMERAGAPLARPIANLALDLMAGISRSRSQMLHPFLIQDPDGRYRLDQNNALVKKASEDKNGSWRGVLNEASAWQRENLAQSMFVQDPETGLVTVNQNVKGAQEKWDSIRNRTSDADQQVVMSFMIALDKVGQIAADRMIDAIGRRMANRISALLMSMNKRMTWEQATDTSGKVLQAYRDGNTMWLQSVTPPEQLAQLDALLGGPEGLLARFKEVSKKLANRPGFRTESLPGDWVVQFQKPNVKDYSYLSAETEHKANWLARKLTDEGNTIVGEIVHKDELKNYTDFDSPDVLLAKFTEVERDVWDKFVEQMSMKHGQDVVESLKQFTPGATTLKELSTKGLNKFLVESQSKVDRSRYDYIDGTFSWVSRLATSMEYQATRQMKDLILADPRARAFPSFKGMVNPHFDNLMQPTSQLSKELRMFASAYMMGGSFASAIVNGTQSVTTLIPTLIQLGKGGVVKAYKDLALAIADSASLQVDDSWQSVAKAATATDPKDWTLDQAKAALYKRNVEDGGINHGIIQDTIFSGTDQRAMMTAKFGHGDYGPVTKSEMVRNATYVGAQLSLKPFGWIESFNNKVALMAGIAQGWEKGLRGEQLYDHAKLVKTLSTYGGGKANVPGLVLKLSTPDTRSAVGVVNTLQQYGYGVVATYAQLLKDSLGKSPGLSPLERRQAVKALGTMLTTQVALGGALGLPFAAASLTLLEKVFGVPANQLVRQGLASLGSDDDQGAVIAETALNGLGNQMFGLDVSSRLGVSNLVGTSSYRGFNLVDMVGPVGSIVSNAAEALNLFGQNQPMKAAKALVPVAMKNAIQMTDTKAKYGDYGIRDAGERLLYQPTPSQAAFFAAGFRPRELSQRRQAQGLFQGASNRSAGQRGRELNDNAQRLLQGDAQTTMRYAQDLRSADPTVDPQSIMRSVVQRAVDSVTEHDLLAQGSTVNEGERQAIAGTFGSGVVSRQSEIQRAQLAAQLGARLGLAPDPKTFQRAAMVDALVRANKKMPRSQAVRLVEFLQ